MDIEEPIQEKPKIVLKDNENLVTEEPQPKRNKSTNKCQIETNQDLSRQILKLVYLPPVTNPKEEQTRNSEVVKLLDTITGSKEYRKAFVRNIASSALAFRKHELVRVLTAYLSTTLSGIKKWLSVFSSPQLEFRLSTSKKQTHHRWRGP